MIATPPAGWRERADRAVARGGRLDALIPRVLLDSPVSLVGYAWGTAVGWVWGTLWSTGRVERRAGLWVFTGMPSWTFGRGGVCVGGCYLTGSAPVTDAVLRQAPDVILVGEMRDYETIKAAVTAAETGHLVMGTLHTNSAPESIDRIVDVFPEEQQEQIRVQLANNLVAVMTQQLLPRLDGQGRILAYELLIANPAVRALIREGKTYQITSVMQTGAREGMVTMDAFLANLYRRRVISFDTGVERAVDSKEFARLANDPSIATAGGVASMPAGYGQAPVQGFGATVTPAQGGYASGRNDFGRGNGSGDARTTSTPETNPGGSGYGRR